MHGTISSLLATYGYVVLFVLVGVEALGIPLPGETALVTAGVLAAVGRLSISAVVVTAAAAAILGDNGGYWIGRTGGTALLRRYGRMLRLDPAHLTRAQTFFERHGAKTVFLGRFVAILRTWTAIIAGTARMPYGVFTRYNALGGVCWALIFGTMGYVAGENLPRLERYVGRATLVSVLLVALLVGSGLGWRWFERNLSALGERTRQMWQHLVRAPALGRLAARFPRTGTLLTARLAAGEYLALHLTVGFAISLVGLAVFGAITEDVLRHDPLTRLDLNLLRWMHRHATPLGNALFPAVGLLGSLLATTAIALATGLWLGVKRRWLLLSGWAAGVAGGGVLDIALRWLIRRPRPSVGVVLLARHAWGLPAGHAMGVPIAYGLLAYILVTCWFRRQSLQVGAVVATALLIAAIGLGGFVIGMYYFSDVVVGDAVGVLWLTAVISGLEIARQLQPPVREESL